MAVEKQDWIVEVNRNGTNERSKETWKIGICPHKLLANTEEAGWALERDGRIRDREKAHLVSAICAAWR